MKNKTFPAGATAMLFLLGFAHPLYAATDTYSGISEATSSGPSGTGLSRGSVGVGAMVGEPIGATLKGWLSRQTAVQYGLFYSLNSYVGVDTDFLYHFEPQSILRSAVKNAVLVPYVGVGLLVAVSTVGARSTNGGPFTPDNPGNVGGEVRVPVGAEVLFRRSSLGLAAEVVPSFAFAPTTTVLLEGDVALRIYL